MTPFRDKQMRWKTGDDTTGRYKNVHGFKFDIIKQIVVTQQEKMPECFLADTPEEAEALYGCYSVLLNAMAYNYALATGLQKVDLFGEALIGLGRAYRDWDSNRSDNFKIYAIYRIRDTLNEFARDNMASVKVPAYIKKAHVHVIKLKEIFHTYGVDTDKVLLCGEIDNRIMGVDRKKCVTLVSNLTKAATRAKATYTKFVERTEYIPEDCILDDSIVKANNNYEESLEAALMMKKLQTYMDEVELSICNDIMRGVSYEMIGDEFGKSSVWVKRKLDKLRDKIVSSWS